MPRNRRDVEAALEAKGFVRVEGDHHYFVYHWAAAYYLAGYAIECGLKSCVLAYVEKNADVIYREKKYSENCWTHDIGTLVKASGLDALRVAEARANLAFGVNWGHALKWSETMRYKFMPESDAKRLYEAVTHHVNGVLPWIRMYW